MGYIEETARPSPVPAPGHIRSLADKYHPRGEMPDPVGNSGIVGIVPEIRKGLESSEKEEAKRTRSSRGWVAVVVVCTFPG